MRYKVMPSLLALTLVIAPAFAADQDAKKPAPEKKPLIQIAVLLDTSNSMDGLIAQAKTHLWRIVNEFATAKQDGVRPELQVALYEYGNNGLNAKEGYVRQVVPLTVDLDKVSEELFALKTNGGHEFCGTVIRDAVNALAWSKSPNDFKAIFIAGNEPFTQGQVDYASACKEAIARGVVVNTIHCGPYETGVQGKWKDGAMLADGSYTNIDQNKRTVQISAPQDKEIAELNAKLNTTYIAYGAFGQKGAERQLKQDAESSKLAGAVLSQRAASKVSGYYSNARWDLVDALEQKKVKLEDLKDADLPENMRKMSMDERRAYVDKQAKQRVAIRAKIQKLADARKTYVAAEMKKLAEADGAAAAAESLDQAIVKTVREQAGAKNFKFEK